MILKYFKWEDCSFETYNLCCERYGYNAESSPEYIDFMNKNGANYKFIAYKKNNEIVGSACLEGGWLANDHKNPNRIVKTLPLPAHSIVVPIDPSVNCLAPFKTKCLSPLTSSIKNANFNILSKRKIAMTKNISDFSKKTKETRKREINRFIDAGGSFVKTDEVNASELFCIYDSLYYKRRGCRVNDSQLNIKFFSSFKDNFIGNILFFNKEPVGIQLLLSTYSRIGLFVNFINIGYDINIKKHPLGTIAMWSNLDFVEKYAQQLNLPLFYSFGAMSGDYKKRWCTPLNVGRILTL